MNSINKSTDRIIAEELWTLLDDISTLSDIIKPTSEKGYQMFYQRTLQLAEKRSKWMVSLDGQTLLTIEEANKQEDKALQEPYEFAPMDGIFQGKERSNRSRYFGNLRTNLTLEELGESNNTFLLERVVQNILETMLIEPENNWTFVLPIGIKTDRVSK